MQNHKTIAAELSNLAVRLDALLKTLGYERVSELIGQSSSGLPELMTACADAIGKVAAESAETPAEAVKIVVSDDDESEDLEVLSASVPEEQLQFLLQTYTEIPVIDQHGKRHLLSFDMDGQTLALSQSSQMVSLQLTLSVSYRLYDASHAEMAENLRRMVSSAISEGRLTGESMAEVEHYDVVVS